MDIVSRVLIHFFSVIVEEDGKFSPWMTLISFYYLVGIMFIFHIFFNERRNYLSEKFWLEILLNSFSSALSYNEIDLQCMMGESSYKKSHKSKFIKKFIY